MQRWIDDTFETSAGEGQQFDRILEATKRGEMNGHIIRGGILYKEVGDDIRVVVPRGMQTQIIRKIHEQGHFGIYKTETLVKADYWIPGLRPKVECVIANCITCILAEKKYGKQECLLNPIEKGSVPLDPYRLSGPVTVCKKKLRTYPCGCRRVLKVCVAIRDQVNKCG